jgi:GH18 family chitinase
VFDIYHGPQPQNVDFGEVLHVVGDFLAAHPSETVLMRLKAECTGGWQLVGSLGWQQTDPLLTCADARGTTNDVITSIFDHYRDQNEGYFWTPSVTGTGAADMPTIGQVRGKIVLWAFDGPHGNPFGDDTDGFYGLSQLVNRATRPTYIQDYYDIPTLVDIQAKWNRVQAHLVATNADLDLDHMYVNFLSGSSAGAHPYSVAPVINFGCLEYLLETNVWRTGMLMMDFPDTKLIEAIIARNANISDTDPMSPADWSISSPEAGTPGERVAYFTSWSIYANGYYLKTLDINGTAGKLTKLNYAFENIDPANLTCFAANAPSSSDESSATGNDGASDAWADYQRGFTADESVDDVADSWGDPLKGNFNQLKKLKARYPNLKTLVTIGGWTFSKYFSDVAATDASRKKFVRSCIDMYIRGNLPQIGDDPAGGTGVAAGVFDGFDIDWEFPGSPDGHTGNHYSAQDAANFTALLAEFRSELDDLGGGHLLTAALPSGHRNIVHIEVPQISQYLDLGHIMTYDMHGAWETNGVTNFQAPTYASPQDPSVEPGLTVDDAITAYLTGGFPASKITLGVPFYARGWQGVPDNGTHGLYQSTAAATDAYGLSQQPGVAFYKELVSDGKLTTSSVFWDPVAKSSWIYDGNNFFSVETPKSLSAKRQVIQDRGLAGVMMYSLEADAPTTTLLKAATNL